jgi:CHAT domain-containing protein/tetratricopeptide (TPR) repeat protein
MGIDRDYEALIRELLAGVAGGWSYGNVIVLLMTKGVNETDLALWLREFANGLSLDRDRELIKQLKLLGKMTPGILALEAFLIVARFDGSCEQNSEFLNHEAWFSTGIDLREQGLYEEAIQSFERAIVINRDYYDAWYFKGVTLCDEMGCYGESIVSFDQAIKICPNDSDSWNCKGIALNHLERYEESIVSFDQAIKIHPNYIEALINRGVSLGNLGMYEESIVSYDRVIKINPNEYRAWLNRGVALHRLKLYEESSISYDQATKIKPNDYRAWYSQGILISEIQEYRTEPNAYGEAFQYIKPALDPYGWSLLQHQIGGIHYDEGIKQLSEYRCDPQPYYDRALTHYHKALTTLTRQQFPELRLETLIDTAKVHIAQHNTPAAHVSKTEALDIFRDLLNAQPTIEAKKRFQLKYTSLRQLDVELFIATGDNVRALEAAELDKNERLTLLLDALQEQTISPTYTEMRQLLTSETTGIIYWHLSPDNLTTFILTTTQPQPLVWNIDNRAPQAQQLKAWIETWDTQYADYRDKKSPKTQPRPNGEATDSKADLPWRTNLTAHLIQLKQILDIERICQQLPANLTNLILIPHGDLHRFPLHILFLIAQKSQIRGCTYLPSIQIGLNLRDRSSQSYTPLLSVEDPKIEGEEPMKFAPIESAIVRHLLPSHNDNTYIDPDAANLAAVETALSNPHASFHFTGHAAYNSRSPEASALALKDEPLTAKRISQLDLSSYNLITLAACETAITGRANINTEYVGLTSAFLQAGAANILSTLWQVDEISNAWFTIYFHQQLLAGHSPAVALTRSQIWLKSVTWQNLVDWLLELKQLPHLKIGIVEKLQAHITNTLEDGGTIGLDRPSKYSHPYHWAAFTLTGRG